MCTIERVRTWLSGNRLNSPSLSPLPPLPPDEDEADCREHERVALRIREVLQGWYDEKRMRIDERVSVTTYTDLDRMPNETRIDVYYARNRWVTSDDAVQHLSEDELERHWKTHELLVLWVINDPRIGRFVTVDEEYAKPFGVASWSALLETYCLPRGWEICTLDEMIAWMEHYYPELFNAEDAQTAVRPRDDNPFAAPATDSRSGHRTWSVIDTLIPASLVFGLLVILIGLSAAVLWYDIPL